MKLSKRKLKTATVFFVCWFALWVLIVDGIIGFRKLQDIVGAHNKAEHLRDRGVQDTQPCFL